MSVVPSRADVQWLAGVSEIAHCNPFTPHRIELERKLLGSMFVEETTDWNVSGVWSGLPVNVRTIAERTFQILEDFPAAGVASSARRQTPEWADAALFVLYHRYSLDFQSRIVKPGPTDGGRGFGFYRDFARDFAKWLPAHGLGQAKGAAHYFACFFQIRRAFHEIFHHIRGRSPAVARLRARVWESVFTSDMRRYQRALFDRMGEHPTLIIGPSGTGKELVARAIARSRFIPFDTSTLRFESDYQTAFHPLNLSAFSPALLESELFGHRRGAFTGALQDRAGWLEMSGPLDTIFLDEIGDVEMAIQVKLLRVLEARTFARLGENQERSFQGKVIAATNRDLAAAVSSGEFRRDFYYRLCGDVVETPGLKERFNSCPDERAELALFIAGRLVGGMDAPSLADQALTWIARHLGDGYDWPGNVREFDQCIRNIMIRGSYTPLREREPGHDREAAVYTRVRTADEVLRGYCADVYARTGSYEATAALVGLDRRTVKKYVTGE